MYYGKNLEEIEHVVSTGYIYLDTNKIPHVMIERDLRWCPRFCTDTEEITAFRIKRSLEHCNDNYFLFEDHLITNAYCVDRFKSKEKHGFDFGFVVIQSIYVLPQFREKGLCRRFLKHCMKIADEEQGVLVIVCRPFRFKHEDEDGMTEGRLLQRYRYQRFRGVNTFDYLIGEDRIEQQDKMKSLVQGLGWKKIDISASMDAPGIFGDYALAYHPNPRKSKRIPDKVYWVS